MQQMCASIKQKCFQFSQILNIFVSRTLLKYWYVSVSTVTVFYNIRFVYIA